MLIDSNQGNIAKAKELGLEAINTNIYSDTLMDNIELNDVGYLMALTGNNDINKYAINKFSKQFGENGSFRLVSVDEMNDQITTQRRFVFHTDDYTFTNVTRKFPAIQEIELKIKRIMKV